MLTAATTKAENRQQTPPPVSRVPVALLARVLDAVGVDASSDVGCGPAESACGPPAESWQEALERVCTSHPVRSRPVFLSAEEAAGAACARTPLVSRGAGERSNGVALLGRTGGRVFTVTGEGDERWLRPAELARELARPSCQDLHPWVLLEPGLASARPSAAKSAGAVSPLRRLLDLLEPERADLSAVVLYAAFIGALTLATPIAVQQLVNSVAFGGLLQPVVVVALLLFGGLAFSAGLSVMQAWVAELIQRRLFVRVSMDLAERIPRVQAGAFDQRHGPELVNRVFDVFTLQKTGSILLLDGTGSSSPRCASVLPCSMSASRSRTANSSGRRGQEPCSASIPAPVPSSCARATRCWSSFPTPRAGPWKSGWTATTCP